MKTRNIFWTAILLLSFTGITYTVFLVKTSVLKTVTRSGAESIGRRMKAYHRKHNRFPNFEELRVALNGEPETILQDAWGHKYRLDDEGKTVLVISAGLDGKFDNEDDLKTRVNVPFM